MFRAVQMVSLGQAASPGNALHSDVADRSTVLASSFSKSNNARSSGGVWLAQLALVIASSWMVSNGKSALLIPVAEIMEENSVMAAMTEVMDPRISNDMLKRCWRGRISKDIEGKRRNILSGPLTKPSEVNFDHRLTQRESLKKTPHHRS